MNHLILGPQNSGKNTLAEALLTHSSRWSLRDACDYQNQGVLRYKHDPRSVIGQDPLYNIYRIGDNNFSIVDSSGYMKFMKNVMTRQSPADFAIVMVSSVHSEFKKSLAILYHQCRFLSQLGIVQIIVIVNKMDLIEYNEQDFLMRCEEIFLVLHKIFGISAYHQIIPASILKKVNFDNKGKRMTWYIGPTLFESLKSIKKINNICVDRPLRISIQDVYRIAGLGTVFMGKVESGEITTSMGITFAPIKNQKVVTEVKMVEMNFVQVESASVGNIVGVCVSNVRKQDLSRGMVAGHYMKDPPWTLQYFESIFHVTRDRSISEGFIGNIHCHSAVGKCRLISILKQFNPMDAEELSIVPSGKMTTGNVYRVVWYTLDPMCLERYVDCPGLSRFEVRTISGDSMGIGIVTIAYYGDKYEQKYCSQYKLSNSFLRGPDCMFQW